MATIIDSFVVQFGLDIKDLQKHVKDIETSLKKVEGGSDHAKKGVEQSNKKIAESYARTIKFVAGFAMALAGISVSKTFISDVTNQAAATGLLAKNLGMSTEELSVWEKAVERAGGSAKGMDATLRSMTTMMQTKRLTGAPGEDVLNGLGWGGFGTEGTSKYLADSTTHIERLQMAAVRFSKMSGPQAQKIGALLGYDEGTINLLMQGTDAVNKIVEAEKKQYQVTKGAADAALARKNAWKDLRDTMEGYALKLSTEYSPQIVQAYKWMAEHALITAGAIGLITAAGSALATSVGYKIITKIFGGRVPPVPPADIPPPPAALAGGGAAAARFGAGLLGKLTGVVGGLLYPSSLGADDTFEGQGRPGNVSSAPNDVLSQVERKWGLKPGLLSSLRQEESSNGKFTTGPMTKYGTAKGDFQMLDSTAKSYGVKNPYDLAQAAEGTGHKLYDLLREFHGSLPNALAAWNQGQGSIAKNGLGMGVQKFASDIIGRMPNGGNTTVTISKMEVHTNGTSAADIGRDAGRIMSSSMAASIANSGLM